MSFQRALSLSSYSFSLPRPRFWARMPRSWEGNFFDELEYRHIGPVGNRVSAVVGVPGDPNVYFIGAASGGVFKTVDGGVHWDPVFDDQPAQSIGALAVDPDQSQRGLGRDRGGPYSKQRQHRQRRLQDHRRREKLGSHGAGGIRADQPHRGPSA